MSLSNHSRSVSFVSTVKALSALTLTVLAVSACSDMPSRPTQERPRKATNSITKTTWFKMLPGAMSDEFCSTENPLMQCYHLSSDDCRDSVKEITTSCEDNYSSEIPTHLGKNDTANWGGTIGGCTKDGMLQLIESKNITPESEACRQTVADM